MARIRSIKPEFPQSESMGRVSRDARLLFIELWTICDDSGRTRGNSRMLASLLFPYDDDAPSLIDGWIAELENEHCIHRYTAEGSTYIQIANWLNHQKIDKPSPSKIPAFVESSRILANPRERSSEDQGEDQGVDQGITPPSLRDVPPSVSVKQKAVTFQSWLHATKAKGEKAVSDYKPVWDYAELSGIPADWIEIAWLRFKDRYTGDEKAKRKRYIDWRGVFLRAVKENWLGLWFYSEKSKSFCLTTVGVCADIDTREAA